eukprot:SAG11_NODE_6222_length_1360_cov_0.931007_1_plen_342_part_00
MVAAFADLGASSREELCNIKRQNPERFCRSCTQSPPWDAAIKTFTTDLENGPCFACKDICIELYQSQDDQRSETYGSGAQLHHDQCFACMTWQLNVVVTTLSHNYMTLGSTPSFSPSDYFTNLFGSSSSYGGGPLFWSAPPSDDRFPDVCRDIKEFCLEALGERCWLPLADRLCRGDAEGRRIAQEYLNLGSHMTAVPSFAAQQLNSSSSLSWRRRLQDPLDGEYEACRAQVLQSFLGVSYMDYDTTDPICLPLSPVLDKIAINGGDTYTCAESAFAGGLCLSYMVGDGECDPGCMVEECERDGGDCAEILRCECEAEWLGDGFCDISCSASELLCLVYLV